MSKFKLIFGLVAGALFGMAFAPKKGSDLRKEIKDEIGSKGDYAKVLSENAKIMGNDIAATAKEIYEDPTVQDQLKKGQIQASEVLEKVKAELSEKAKDFQKKMTEHLSKKTSNCCQSEDCKDCPEDKECKEDCPCPENPKKSSDDSKKSTAKKKPSTK